MDSGVHSLGGSAPGVLEPVIDATYPLAELPAALVHLDRGAFGKLVIHVRS